MSKINLSKTIKKILSRIRREKTRAVPKETSQVSENESEKQMKKILKKVYLKALPLKSIEDLNSIKDEVRSGNILILRVSPLAKKSIDDVQRAVSELCEFTQSIGGDIARLGQERIVLTPSFVNIWREKAKTSEAESTAAL